MAEPVTLITGTSTGLGQETALHLARKGHRVFATMRSPERGAAPLRDTAKKEGLQITVSALDVCDPKSIQRGVAAVLKDAGQIISALSSSRRTNRSRGCSRRTCTARSVCARQCCRLCGRVAAGRS